MDFPQASRLPLFISSYSKESAAAELRTQGAMTTVAVTWVANVVVYVPIYLPWPYPVNRMFWANGSTIGSNVNVGIFRPNGARVFQAGTTAQVGTSTLQFVTPGTTFWLEAGRYYLAFTCDGTTNRAHGYAATVLNQQTAGALQQAANFALADPATFATAAQAIYPTVGITRTQSGF